MCSRRRRRGRLSGLLALDRENETCDCGDSEHASGSGGCLTAGGRPKCWTAYGPEPIDGFNGSDRLCARNPADCWLSSTTRVALSRFSPVIPSEALSSRAKHCHPERSTVIPSEARDLHVDGVRAAGEDVACVA